MLHVQAYLLSKSFEDLTAELGVRVVRHETEPLVILNYDQIESPKIHPVTRECRGLVLHTETKEIVARSFSRFFNWGEVAEEMKDFDFRDFCVQSKEDGSLLILYYFNGRWRANTRGSFGMDIMQFQTFTWQEAFCKAMGISDLQELDAELDRGVTYVCEFCSPWNKIVRNYPDPVCYLLTAFAGKDELGWSEVDFMSHGWFRRPARYNFYSMEEIQAFIQSQAEKDPTFEGVVIHDHLGHRWKIKSPTYLGLHRLRGEGDNLFAPKNLIPFVLAGEASELLTYFPEVEQAFNEVKAKVDAAYTQMMAVWEVAKDIPAQKDFALAILKKTPFTGILFDARKKGVDPKALWRGAANHIIKTLY